MDLTEFECIRCHACCRTSGYVRLHPDEPDAIAKLLGMDVYAFTDAYTCVTRDRQTLSLIEQPDGACIFLTPEGCRIQPAKPLQCKNFPLQWKFSKFKTICGWAKTRKETP